MKKKIIIIILIYLVGCVIAYNFTKFNLTREVKDWRVKDRNFTLVISCGSWFTVVADCVVIVVIEDSEKPAKW